MSATREAIAVIGIGCRYPGGVNNPGQFWELLQQGRDAVGEITPDRWNIERHYHPTQGIPGKSYSRWAGLLDNVVDFEPERFGISPREAHFIDPQQRLLLECAWDALEDAGIPLHAVTGTQTGVFVGISTADYSQLQQSPVERSAANAHTATGGVASVAANRVSYCFNLHGPSLAVDTACSSSLVATDLACRALWTGEAEMALVGGVNVILTPAPFIAFSAASMLSPDGRCKPFDADGNGFVRGEGAGMVLLKPLSRAEADGDPIYAVIRGTGANEDGRTTGIVMPSADAQRNLLIDVYGAAGIDPRSVSYVEAHGTGTGIGDPIEASALGAALGQMRDPADPPLLIGSVKSNIGHLEAGAGMAGLIKAVLSLHHGAIPANLHFKKPNPRIPFDKLRLKVVDTPTPLASNDGEPVVVGVNSFGFGGANAHVALQAHRNGLSDHNAVALHPAPPYLLALSASGEEGLKQLAQSYVQLAGDANAPPLHDICYSAALHRSHLEHRLALAVNDMQELGEHLNAWLEGERRPGVVAGRRGRHQEAHPVFVFSGQGPQWWAMGRELLETEPAFRQVVERCDELIQELGGWSLLAELRADQSASRMDDTAISQPALFALQVGCARVLEQRGIRPAAVVGHSVGEVAAAHIAGALTLDDAVRVIYHRGRTMGAAPGGRMLALGVCTKRAAELVEPYAGRIAVAASNAPASVTLSGDADALQELADSFADGDVFCRFLPVNYAFHSHHMEPIREDLLASLAGITAQEPTIPIASTVRGDIAEGDDFAGAYWWDNVRQPVQFAEGLAALIGAGYDLFLEISPHPVLTTSINQNLKHHQADGLVIGTLRREESDRRQLLAVVGALYCAGYPVDWRGLWPQGGTYVKLPPTPWERQPYWHEPESSREFRCGRVVHPLLDRALPLPKPSWETPLDLNVHGYLADHRVQGLCVFPAAAYVEMAIAASQELHGTEHPVIEDLQFDKAVFVSESGEDQRLQFSFSPDDNGFAISTRTLGRDETWTQNVAGYLSRPATTAEAPAFDPALCEPPVLDEVEAEECYQQFATVGLHYGPAFSGVQRVTKYEGYAIGEVELPEAATLNLAERYWVNPALLDACFQVMLGMMPRGTDRLYLPVHIDRIRCYQRPGRSARVVTKLRRMDDKSVFGDLHVYNADGSAALRIEGFLCRAMATATTANSQRIDDCLYRTDWTLTRGAPAQDAAFLDALEAGCQASVDTVGAVAAPWLRRMPEAHADTARLTVAYVVRALGELGVPLQAGAEFALDAVCENAGVMPERRQQLRRLLHHVTEAGLAVQLETDRWRLSELSGVEVPERLYGELVFKQPACYAELTLIRRCGARLADMLTGRLNTLELLFDDEGQRLLSQLYQDSPVCRYYNALIARQLSQAVAALPPGRKLRILEIGAGTGGLTSGLLPLLPPEQCDYLFTDVTPVFLDKAQTAFKDFPFVRYGVYNVEKPLAEQDLEPGSFDLVLASDVLHATPDIRASLRGVRELLAPGGALMAIEAEKSQPWLDLVFGLTDGWWCFADDLREGHPLISRERWLSVLRECGFAGEQVLPLGPVDRTQAVLQARRPLQSEMPTAPADVEAAVDDADGAATGEAAEASARPLWLVFADGQGLGRTLPEVLRTRDVDSCLVTGGDAFSAGADGITIRPGEREDYARVFAQLGGRVPASVLFLWPLDADSDAADAAQAACERFMNLVQALADSVAERRIESAVGLVLVTQNAQAVSDTQAVSCAQAAALAMGRVVANEHGYLRYRSVDLDAGDLAAQTRALLDAIDSDEDETAVRNGAFYAPRITRLEAPSRLIDLAADDAEKPSFRLQPSDAGTLDGMALRERPRTPPGPGQVEIEVGAAALNFRDVLKALNLYPADGGDAGLLGDELAGRITALGEGVTKFSVGQEVFGIAPAAFGSYALTRSEMVLPRPETLDREEAASVPITFLTAHYALHELARIAPGESILIQAGAGGVGLAALQIAKRAGAVIYATAGTPDKRELLRSLGAKAVMDSRSLAFADEIMALTNGRGVDIVLNSLAGHAIHKGIACLAPFGRFLELGKRDIYENRRVGLWAFRQNLAFFGIDLSRLMTEKPHLIESMMAEVAAHLASGDYRALPYRAYPLVRIKDAFRYMAKGQHTGKVVVSIGGGAAQVRAAPPAPFELQGREGSFLITGGLGGFGLEIARWLVKRGARHLVLVSRRGVADEAATAAIEQLRGSGAEVVLRAADVADADQVDALIADLAGSMPPLSGIFHAAMVIDDGLLLQLDAARLRKVLEPKVGGCVNLHRATQDRPLRYFVMFSSASALAGNPGQANYVAANGFLDAFAHYRRAQGLPALTVNWGRIADVGYVARSKTVGDALDKRGFEGITPDRATEALERLLMQGLSQAAVMRMNWQAVANLNAQAARSKRYERLGVEESERSGTVERGLVRRLIADRPAAERYAATQDYVTKQVSRVLGTAASRLDPDELLNELGLDSLMAVELINQVEVELDVSLPTAKVIQEPTITKLTTMALDQMGLEYRTDGVAKTERRAA